jgi:hypothetical protein
MIEKKIYLKLNGKGAELYQLLTISKKKAIEQALILLAKDKTLAPIFFENMDEVERILSNQTQKQIKLSPTIKKEEKLINSETIVKNKEEKKVTKNNEKFKEMFN